MFPSVDLPARTEAAIERYERELNYYRGAARLNYGLYWMTATISFGALTPVLLLTSLPKVVQSLPAPLAAVAAGLNGSFNFRDDYCRHSYTTNALSSESNQFEVRCGPNYGLAKSDDEVLETFAQRIAKIADGEVADWQRLFLKETGARAARRH